VIGFKNLESLALGQSGQIEISFETIASFKIPFPPLDIQQKIVAEIEVLEQKEEKAKKEIEALKIDIFEKVDNNIQKYKTDLLGNLTTLITKGSSPTWQGINYTDAKEVLFVTSENVREGFLDLTTKKYLENKFNDIQSRSVLQKEDILINIVGASIGRAAFYDLDEVANINQAVALVRCNKSLLNHKFASYFLNSQKAKELYDSMKIDVARANLSLQNISDIAVPLPPLSEQQKIVAEIEQIESQIAALEAEFAEIPKQKEATLKRYL
jgi:restriction endonuclease S subunit